MAADRAFPMSEAGQYLASGPDRIQRCTGRDHCLASLREYVGPGHGTRASAAEPARRAPGEPCGHRMTRNEGGAQDPSSSSAFNRTAATSQGSDHGKGNPRKPLGGCATRAEQGRIRGFYRDVLGCEILRQTDLKDDFRMGGNFYIGVLYENEGVVLDEAGFSKATYLELQADNVEEMRQKIVAFGVRVLEMHDPHLYFQAPGGQVFRLVGINEDLSRYEGTDHRELPGVFG